MTCREFEHLKQVRRNCGQTHDEVRRPAGVTAGDIIEKAIDVADPLVTARQVDDGDRVKYRLLTDGIELRLRGLIRCAHMPPTGRRSPSR